jgi:hypothetical protein
MNRLSHALNPLSLLLALSLTPGGAAVAQPAPPIVSVTSAAPVPVDPERLAIAQDVVALAFPPAMRQAMFVRVADSMMAQFRQATFGPTGAPADPGAEAIYQRLVDRIRAQVGRSVGEASPELFAAFARAYARMFTREELIQIRAFVATPAGAKYVQRSADLMSDPDVARANTAYLTHYLAALKPVQEQFMRELTDYYAKHAPQKRP